MPSAPAAKLCALVSRGMTSRPSERERSTTRPSRTDTSRSVERDLVVGAARPSGRGRRSRARAAPAAPRCCRAGRRGGGRPRRTRRRAAAPPRRRGCARDRLEHRGVAVAEPAEQVAPGGPPSRADLDRASSPSAVAREREHQPGTRRAAASAAAGASIAVRSASSSTSLGAAGAPRRRAAARAAARCRAPHARRSRRARRRERQAVEQRRRRRRRRLRRVEADAGLLVEHLGERHLAGLVALAERVAEPRRIVGRRAAATSRRSSSIARASSSSTLGAELDARRRPAPGRPGTAGGARPCAGSCASASASGAVARRGVADAAVELARAPCGSRASAVAASRGRRHVARPLELRDDVVDRLGAGHRRREVGHQHLAVDQLVDERVGLLARDLGVGVAQRLRQRAGQRAVPRARRASRPGSPMARRLTS